MYRGKTETLGEALNDFSTMYEEDIIIFTGKLAQKLEKKID